MSASADLPLVLLREEEVWRRYRAGELPRVGVVESSAALAVSLGHRLPPAMVDAAWDHEPAANVIPFPATGDAPETFTATNNMVLRRQRAAEARRDRRQLGRDIGGLAIAVVMVIALQWMLMLSQGR